MERGLKLKSMDEQIMDLADKYASQHFNKEYSPDQHWACVCSYKQGYIDAQNKLPIMRNRTELEEIAFYESHLQKLEKNKDKLSHSFCYSEKQEVEELIWRLKNYNKPIENTCKEQ